MRTRLRERVEEGDSWNLYAAMTEQTINEIIDYSVSQNLTTLRNRVNELGVSEPLVQRQGRNRIVVELPGIQDTAEAKRILGKVANLEFRLVANMDAAPSEKQRFEYRSADRAGMSEWLERDLSEAARLGQLPKAFHVEPLLGQIVHLTVGEREPGRC